MKKVLLFICFLVSANLMFAATEASMSLNQIEVTGAAQTINVSVTVDYITATAVTGVQLSILYNPAYLTWNGTQSVPGPGVSYKDPGFTAIGPDYLWNTGNPGNLIMTWIDPEYGFGANPMVLANGDLLISYSFTYNGTLAEGAESAISFSLTAVLKDGGYTKIVNELVDQDFSPCTWTGPCGGLCDGKIWRAGGVVGKTWTGAAGDGLWFTAGNWAPPGVPTATDDVTIPGTKATVTISGGVATTATLTNNGSIIIAPTGGLTTNGLFTNNGGLDQQSDNGPGYAGTYIDNGGIAGPGLFTLDRNVICTGTQAGTGNPLGWHYLSAPFDGFTTDGLTQFFVNAWNQPTGMWMQYEGPIGIPCTPISPAISLPTMGAWSINYDNDYVPNCGGVMDKSANFLSLAPGVHSGPMGVGLGYGAGMYQNWNLVGNPYPSGLDVNTIAFGPNTVAATYYYDGCSGNYVYWATGLGSYVMAPTLGFFVETTGNDALAVNNSMRAHNADWFWKNEVANLLTLKASGNDRSDVLNVRFADDVTADFDKNGDAHKLFAETEGLPQIYTFAGEEMLAINALPETALVHMGFRANGSGTYTIEAVETSEFANVVLEDVFTGIQTDLLAGSYTFDYNVSDADNRFVIHFTPLGVNELSANAINIWAANQTIYVQAPATTGDIVVYNLMGQEVVRTAIEAGVNEIPMNESNTYYIVKVLGNEVTETGKVFIK